MDTANVWALGLTGRVMLATWATAAGLRFACLTCRSGRVGVAEYHGDEGDSRYEGWSYLGDRYRCPLADDELSCHLRANRLLMQRREDGLRQMADAGHRCAFCG